MIVDPVKSREAAARLNSLLAEFDPGAADFLEANRGLLLPLFQGGSWADLERLVQAYSFADAQARVEEALRKLPIV